jgi:hypothetical protein
VHPDLERGWTAGTLPMALRLVYDVIFRYREERFFGQLEDTDPVHAQRHAATVAVLQAAGDAPDAAARLAATAQQVADAMRRQDESSAVAALATYVLRFFKGDVSVTAADVADLQMVLVMVGPGWRWLSPLHSMWLREAKERLHARLGSNELMHHALASLGTYERVLKPALSPAGLARIRAAGSSAEGGLSVLRLFDTAVPDVGFRMTRKATDLGGLVSAPVPERTLVLLQLNRATTREHRFLACCGQRVVTDLVYATVRACDPTLPLLPAASNNNPITY